MIAAAPPTECGSTVFRRTRQSVAVYRQCDPGTSVIRELYDFLARQVSESTSQSAFLRSSAAFAHLRTVLEEAITIQPDWNGYQAPSPDTEAVRAASAFLDALEDNNLVPTTIVPSAEGGIAIYFNDGGRTAYVEYGNEGDVVLGMYADTGEPQVLDVTAWPSSNDAIAAIRGYLTNTRA